ncbi:MAG: ThiF family adenylyltransferase [Cytophagales bacterium]
MKEITDFSRIKGAVNIELLCNSHIAVVGAGGSFSLNVNLARMGLGKLTVIDYDSVEESNLVRQGYGFQDIGQPKVTALGKYLRNTNYATEYEGINSPVQNISIEEQDQVFNSADLLLFLTDSFQAQSYGNKIALKYNKPAIWAGFYGGSRGGEIIFMIPGVTKGCFRCAVKPRYDMVSGDSSVPPSAISVTSDNNTMFHSQLLDSYIGMLAMAILHNDTEGFEYSNWFGKSWNKNFIQFNVHPDFEMKDGQLFRFIKDATQDGCLNFNAAWIEVEKTKPQCDDCNPEAKLID